MPNRIIKESICTSDNLNELTPEQEVFFYRLIVSCDDFGRMDGRPQIILSRCYPLKMHVVSVSDIEEWLQALVQQQLIILYDVDGRRYLQMTTWDKHQQRRAKKSKYPAPPAFDSNNNNLMSDDIRCSQLQSNVPENEYEYENRESRIENRESRNEYEYENRESEINPDSGRCHDCDSDVLQSFEQEYGRALSPFEVEKLRSWLDELNGELILHALKTAVLAQNRSFRYIDGILRRWKGAGVKSVQDVEELDRQFKAAKQHKARGQPAEKSREKAGKEIQIYVPPDVTERLAGGT